MILIPGDLNMPLLSHKKLSQNISAEKRFSSLRFYTQKAEEQLHFNTTTFLSLSNFVNEQLIFQLKHSNLQLKSKF